MRHGVDGRKFDRNTPLRMATFRCMANSVIEKEQIVTTQAKAKEVRRVVDRLITLGKKGSPHARRIAFGRTRSKLVVERLFTILADRYKSRPGGYTRVIKLSDRRLGDAAEMAVLELVDHPPLNRKKVPTDKGKQAADAGSDEKKTPEVQDPFNKFRRLFSGKKKVSGSKKGAGAQAGVGTERRSKV